MRRITVFIVSCSILEMCCIIQCERDFCGKMKLNAPAFGTAPPICAKTMAGHCNDKKKKNSKALELNRIKCKKKYMGRHGILLQRKRRRCLYI